MVRITSILLFLATLSGLAFSQAVAQHERPLLIVDKLTTAGDIPWPYDMAQIWCCAT